ncbi:hypothetical protein DUNSADRAFT_18568 [Dunaliella salina]|uniref:Encoded protein n=1 Tax=Dunaliella salina TaxID=3046 RepID=A0ABQ7GYX0_DUNSA|nr:hypothetical protein DUNSADRAFT_18568 [Dunaliella salina]|eukprot:KAF5839805.1 hypothetical protein DUNSADRAFT_18568 [Dunaliella salina]
MNHSQTLPFLYRHFCTDLLQKIDKFAIFVQTCCKKLTGLPGRHLALCKLALGNNAWMLRMHSFDFLLLSCVCARM